MECWPSQGWVNLTEKLGKSLCDLKLFFFFHQAVLLCVLVLLLGYTVSLPSTLKYIYIKLILYVLPCFIHRFVQGVPKKECYRFYHWQYVDLFVYFSHHFVSIPPPGWTNAAHTNGVSMLGWCLYII